MKVKVFDESHEKDLENDINNFIKENNVEVFDIKFSVSVSMFSEEQIYCFSALVMYTEGKVKEGQLMTCKNVIIKHLQLLY